MKQRRKAIHPFLEQWFYRFGGDIAPCEAGAAGCNDDFDAPVINPRSDLLPNIIDIVARYCPRCYLVSGPGYPLDQGITGAIVRNGARVGNRQYGYRQGHEIESWGTSSQIEFTPRS